MIELTRLLGNQETTAVSEVINWQRITLNKIKILNS